MTRRRHLRVAAAALGLVVLASACSSGGDDEATPTTAGPTSTSSTVDGSGSTVAPLEGTLDQVELATQEIAELDEPIALAARPSSADLFVAEKGGTVRHIKVTTTPGTTTTRYQLQTTPILDLSDEVINDGEQGLLGLAFSTDGRRLFADFTAEPDGRTVVLEFEVDDRGVLDESSRRELLEVDQPAANHNGGNLVVGPDGYLYVGLGDGGGAGDPDGNGQDPTTLLGSILRIDPTGGTERKPYAVPAGNPFADGEDGAPEVWLYGVRNPWRFSFDRATGDLWVADVGQSEWEEIDFLPADGGFDAGRGANLGWDEMEGTHEFEGANPAGAILPIFEYSHDEGCAITGGYAYRGEAIPELVGAYLFADYCVTGLRAIQIDGASVIDHRVWDDLPLEAVQSFGEDQNGELYALLASGPLLKLVPAGAGDDADDGKATTEGAR